MEKLKNVHDHKLTDILKVLIFTLVMLLPGIVFIPSCLYYGFNEHAVNTETTDITYKYQSNEVTTLDDLVEGNIYYIENIEFADDSLTNQYGEFYLYVYQFNLFNNSSNYNFVDDVQTYEYDSKTNNRLTIQFIHYANNTFETFVYYTNENSYVSVQYESSISFTDIVFSVTNNTLSTFKTFCQFNNILPQYTDYNEIDEVVVNTDNTISTQISRNWTQMWQQPMFSWTNNTPLNTGLNSFIGIFGINAQSCISNLLIWLLSMTAIYVVIDIVLGVFKWLTHMIGNK